MAKQQKEFLNISSPKLIETIDKTLDDLKLLGWERKYKKEEKNKIIWGISVPSKKYLLSMGFYDYISRAWGAYHKRLKVEVSGNRILVECVEEAPGLSIDFSGEKKKIVKEFFSRLDSMINGKK